MDTPPSRSKNLPDHIPIEISPEEIPRFKQQLLKMGYATTFYQIRKPRQLFGYIIARSHGGREVEHHVRCFTNGKILTEVELKRLDEMWLHLTSRSISAHELVIEILEEIGIQYSIDTDLRDLYKEFGPKVFVRDYWEFFRWLIFGVIFWSPLGYIWIAFHKFSIKMGWTEDI